MGLGGTKGVVGHRGGRGAAWGHISPTKVIQQALHRQPNTAAQYLQQMYAAQQQHLMLQTAALQQQHLTSAQLQSLAAVQQVWATHRYWGSLRAAHPSPSAFPQGKPGSEPAKWLLWGQWHPAGPSTAAHGESLSLSAPTLPMLTCASTPTFS